MDDYTAEIDAALSSQAEIPKDKVAIWIEANTDLRTLAKIFRIMGEGYYRIKPELGKELECAAVQNYLLECIRQDVKDDDEIETRYEAAATLHGWLRQLLESEDCDDIIKGIAGAITEMYLLSAEDI